MAKLSIGGDVGSIGWEGKRITVWEKYNSRGNDYTRLWTCWFSESQAMQLQEQDFVEISGELSTKIGNYTDKQGIEKTVVEHHLNDAQLVNVVSKDQQGANASRFDTTPPFNPEEAPF